MTMVSSGKWITVAVEGSITYHSIKIDCVCEHSLILLCFNLHSALLKYSHPMSKVVEPKMYFAGNEGNTKWNPCCNVIHLKAEYKCTPHFSELHLRK